MSREAHFDETIGQGSLWSALILGDIPAGETSSCLEKLSTALTWPGPPLLQLYLILLFLPPHMARNKNKKGKSSPKGRGRVTRKTSRGPSITTVPSKNYYADGERVTLRFSDSYVATQGASGGALSTLIYKLNSLFQVNQTAGSGTPQGVTNLTGRFQRYIVHGSTIRWRIRFLQPGGTFGSLGVVGAAATTSDLMSAVLYPKTVGSTFLGSVAAAAVQKYASRRFDWPRDRPVIAGAYEPTQINPAEVWRGSARMSSAKLDANPDPKIAEYQAVFGADPANLQLWVFNFQDVVADATAKGVWFVEVDLSYDVYAFDRIAQGDLLAPVSQGLVTMRPRDPPDAKSDKSVELKTMLPRSTPSFLSTESKEGSPPETVDRYTPVAQFDSERWAIVPKAVAQELRSRPQSLKS